jgi:hypothetical protein
VPQVSHEQSQKFIMLINGEASEFKKAPLKRPA